MQRTNIYLGEEQCARLDRLDVGLRGTSTDAEADVAAIEASFGALRERVPEAFDRSEDGRRPHPDGLWRR